MKTSNHISSIALSGCIRSIPLLIEDKETKEVIKRSSLYLHCSKHPSSHATDFAEISVTAMNQEGCYNTIITKENCSELKRKGNYTDDEWEEIVSHLFPIEELAGPSKADNLTTSAKLISSKSYYDTKTKELIDDDELPLVSEIITVDIKTKSKLPVTVGSIDIRYVDAESDVDINKEILKEQNLFNWIDLLLFRNQVLGEELTTLRATNSSLTDENACYRSELELSTVQQKAIIDDIQDKFYQVLNAKKDKIWELENKGLDHLEGLNQSFLAQNKFNLKNETIDKDKIPDKLDEIYMTSPKKRKSAPSNVAGKSRKRVRKKESTVSPQSPKRQEASPLSAATKKLSDREIVSSIYTNDEATTDVDDVVDPNKDDNNTDYSDGGSLSNGDENERALYAKEGSLLPASPPTTDAIKLRSDTDYESDSDNHDESAHSLASIADEVEDSLQSK